MREVFSDAPKNHVDLLPSDVGMPGSTAKNRENGGKVSGVENSVLPCDDGVNTPPPHSGPGVN